MGDTWCAIIGWDWRGQIDLDDLAEYVELAQDANPGLPISVREVYTGSDEYAVLIASPALDRDQTQAVYDWARAAEFDLADTFTYPGTPS